uniref:LigA n=1 Tax=Parastrongyloides trichosuri TaxID=131310 RepID=A0A0N4ZAF2_PARTI
PGPDHGGQGRVHAAAIAVAAHRHGAQLIVRRLIDKPQPRRARPRRQPPLRRRAPALVGQGQRRLMQRHLPRRLAQHGHPTIPLRRRRPQRLHQRRQRILRRHRPVDDIARHPAVHRPDRKVRFGQPAALQNGLDQPARIAAHPPVQPVPRAPGARIGPHLAQRRKRRIGPRVPTPDIRPFQHRPAIDARDRIVHRLRIVPQHRLDQPPLHPVVAGARRMRRQSVLTALRVLEQVGRIAPTIHRRTAELGQPDRLHPRNPGRRRRLPCAADALMVRVGPPALQVLVAPDPVLAVRAVLDRRAPLRRPVRVRGVVPVIPLAARHLRRQIGRVRQSTERLRIQPAVAAAPVPHRRIPVDSDVIDVRIGPQRIE